VNLSRILPCGVQILYLRFIPLVCVLFINIGLGFVIKSEFYLSWVYIPILLLGLNGKEEEN
jgi:hypothetical protein